MHLGQVMQEYDFTEAILLAVGFEDRMRTLVLEFEYYWDLPDVPLRVSRPWQPVRVRLHGCRRTWFMSDDEYLANQGTPHVPSLTVIQWGDATRDDGFSKLCAQIRPDELAIHFVFAGPSGELEIAAVCKNMGVDPEPQDPPPWRAM